MPAPFDGLGVQANFTHADVKTEFVTATRAVIDLLPGLSKGSYRAGEVLIRRTGGPQQMRLAFHV